MLGLATTDGVKPSKDVLSRDRSVEALKFGIKIERDGYNLFVFGEFGSG